MQSIKAIVAATAIALAALCASQPAQADEPTFYVAAPQANDWQTVNLTQTIAKKDGIVYLPLRATFKGLHSTITVNPDGQTNLIKVTTGQSAYKLYTSTQGNTKFIGVSPNGPWYQTKTLSGNLYIPMSFMQTLTNRHLAVVSDKQLALVDQAPTWASNAKGTYNQNPFWRGTMQSYVATTTVATQAATTAQAAPAAMTAARAASVDGNAIIQSAETQMGVPYVWGGMSPEGFDCSGLTSYIYAQFGIQIPRTAEAQRCAASPVALDQLQPGDLVFWGQPAYHVGIYIGDGQYIHAPQPGQNVSIGSVQWFPYTSGGRI